MRRFSKILTLVAVVSAVGLFHASGALAGDRRWSFTLAEIMNEPVAMPRELAARLLVAIVDELEQEREAFGDDGDGNSEIGRALQVD